MKELNHIDEDLLIHSIGIQQFLNELPYETLIDFIEHYKWDIVMPPEDHYIARDIFGNIVDEITTNEICVYGNPFGQWYHCLVMKIDINTKKILSIGDNEPALTASWKKYREYRENDY